MPYYPNHRIDVDDLLASNKIRSFIHDMTKRWPEEHFVTETENECSFRDLPRATVQVDGRVYRTVANCSLTGQVSFADRVMTYDLEAMLARRQRIVEYINTTSLYNMYKLMIESTAFLLTVHNCADSFFESLNGKETKQIDEWLEQFGAVPTSTGETAEQICSILLDPNFCRDCTGYDHYEFLQDSLNEHVERLDEDIDDLQFLIEQATEAA